MSNSNVAAKSSVGFRESALPCFQRVTHETPEATLDDSGQSSEEMLPYLNFLLADRNLPCSNRSRLAHNLSPPAPQIRHLLRLQQIAHQSGQTSSSAEF